jgi:soluble lytic murein transglycosylase
MKQESGFNPNAKSPSAARGLLQLTIDTARKFAPRTPYKTLREDDLYRPEVNAAIGCAYIAELLRLFPNNFDAVAASYNGGEDNAARWVKRANNPDAGIFAAEVGFSETKTYVFKVLANYRAYQMLYTNELKAR